MLTALSIKNFAIIEQLDVQFHEGLTVLTGETGAGKSIIIDAVQLLAGGRSSTHFIRYGSDKAELEGLFHIEEKTAAFSELLDALGIEVEDEIVLRRELNRNGKTTSRINGKLVTIAILREVASFLVDIHGQHENQELMQEKYHIQLLDHFAPASFQETLLNYQTIFEEYQQLKRQIEQSRIDEQTVAQHIDLYSFQLNEIDEADLKVDEEELLENEQLKLRHFHRLFERLQTAYDALSAESKGLDYVGTAMSDLEEAATIDDNLQPTAEIVASSFYSLQDVVHTLSHTIDELEFDPARVEVVQSRLATIQNLKRKYGQSIEEILLYRESIAEKLDELIHRDEYSAKQLEQLKDVEENLKLEAEELTLVRRQVAIDLKKAIEEQLVSLHMGKSSFEVMISPKRSSMYDERGADDVQFFISTNIGEPLQPLVKVASGGEISRMMLALKTVFSRKIGVTSIIFDEVDTGVSGRVAQAIAEKIATIATHSQVLCISHLPQVAAMADEHYFISKEVKNDRTSTGVTSLGETERVEEISRMLSGTEITSLSMEAANELIQLAKEKKATF